MILSLYKNRRLYGTILDREREREREWLRKNNGEGNRENELQGSLVHAWA
jgi:hypothetical protein